MRHFNCASRGQGAHTRPLVCPQAIRQLDGQVCLPNDPRQRLLIVKYANSNAAMGGAGGSGGNLAGASSSGSDPAAAMQAMQQQQMQAMQYQQYQQLGGGQLGGGQQQGGMDMSAAAAYGAQHMPYGAYAASAPAGMYGQQF